MKRQQVLPWCPRKRSLEQPELGKGQRLTVLAEKLGVPLHSHVGSSPEKKSSPSPLVPISQPTPCSEAKLLSLHRYEEIISTLTFPSYRSLEKETHSQSRVKFCPSHWQSVLDASASIDSSLMASRSRLGLIWEKAVQAVSVCGIRLTSELLGQVCWIGRDLFSLRTEATESEKESHLVILPLQWSDSSSETHLLSRRSALARRVKTALSLLFRQFVQMVFREQQNVSTQYLSLRWEASLNKLPPIPTRKIPSPMITSPISPLTSLPISPSSPMISTSHSQPEPSTTESSPSVDGIELDQAQLERIRQKSQKAIHSQPDLVKQHLSLMPEVLRCVFSSFVSHHHWSRRLDQLARDVASMMQSNPVNFPFAEILSILTLATQIVPDWCTLVRPTGGLCFKILKKHGADYDAALRTISSFMKCPHSLD